MPPYRRKYPGMTLPDNPLYIRLLAEAQRLGHAGIKKQVENLRGKSRGRLQMAVDILRYLPPDVDLDEVTL